MKHFEIAAFLAIVLTAVTGQAQHQPYAAEQSRDIKALSAEEVKQYLSGGGMGYAKAAELNRFPGPGHVLELADKIGLTPEQRAAVDREALAEAVRGAAALEGEYRLSHLDAHRRTRAILSMEQIGRYDELRGYAKPAAAEDEHQH